MSGTVSMGLRKPSGPVVAALHDAVPDDARVQHRKMFGCPCLFAAGNMFAGVHGEDLFIRLPEDLRETLLKRPDATPFEPLPGRGVMRQYVCVGETMLDDREELRRWLNESMQYALSLPPKPKKKDKGRKRKTASHIKPGDAAQGKLAARKVANASTARKAHRAGVKAKKKRAR